MSSRKTKKKMIAVVRHSLDLLDLLSYGEPAKFKAKHGKDTDKVLATCNLLARAITSLDNTKKQRDDLLTAPGLTNTVVDGIVVQQSHAMPESNYRDLILKKYQNNYRGIIARYHNGVPLPNDAIPVAESNPVNTEIRRLHREQAADIKRTAEEELKKQEQID